MQIIVDARDLDKLVRGLDKLQRQVAPAIARGLNEGGDKVRTQVRAAMRAQTGLIRLNSVTRRERNIRAFATGLAPKSGIGPSRGAVLSYSIIYQGSPVTRPREFKVSIETGPGGGVTVFMWGKAHKFKRSFVGGGTIAGMLKMRKYTTRFPVRGFDGPNLAKEAVKDEVAKTFIDQAETVVTPIIEKHLAKGLSL